MADHPLPECRALILSGDQQWRDLLCSRLCELEARGSEDSQRFLLSLEGLSRCEALLEQAERDGSLQCVVLDAASLPDTTNIIAKLRRLRSEVDIFIAVSSGERSADERCELVDRDDTRAEILLRRLRRAIAKRASTPFADTLRDYVEGARDAWHTPGHSSGDGLRESPWVADFYRMMGEHVFNADLSVSVQELDSLLEPSHVIHSAQDLASDAFGAKHTFFVTNGTSMANKVIVQHVLGNGGKMLVDQACHKSVHHAAIMSGVDPVYLPASVNETYGLYGPVSKASIEAAIDAHPDAALLVLTSCSYDGFYYDLEPIIRRAHAAGMKVLVDEAWYAHGYFHPKLRPCALESGADYVTQSTHKMLSAFSQASMIHVADPRFDEARFREHLNMHTSTSPQYGLIASLDVARKQMSMEGFSRLDRCIGFARELRDGIAATGRFRVLSLDDMLPAVLRDDGVRLDPTKLTIDVSQGGCGARELQKALYEKYSIQVEKITHNTLSVLVTLGTTQSKVLRLLNALRSLARDIPAKSVNTPAPRVLPAMGVMELSPREAYFASSEDLPLNDESHGINRALVGRVSADQLVPYPPGIPVLVPGQRISEDVLHYLLDLYHGDSGIELHGLAKHDGRPMLRVSATGG
ncbi:aminotransferase class I/II-fold pyridoxal phosphate-dependent enzyme [Congregibacter litoralis]|uniref:Arginine/lysine/ornithine decarboxylase n=1 Tax=Congregibacter litoralis KT71 TaxID=314285 RepID=A4A820_9GAMM|nr:aminotransferase class I/II-fold pyridoxal phosphate-dependent enzyme [Congregibacter litoralis]EAQ97815.1 Arginine/lysine/ornithine decarboxylase [Congregibacter litoralis KT71]